MKNLSLYYQTKTNKQLRVMRSKKVLLLMKQQEDKSWMARRDEQATKQYIIWIDAVLASRSEQTSRS